MMEVPAAVGADGPGERGQRRDDPLEEELPPAPPAGTKNQDFGIAAVLGEEEGLGKVARSRRVRRTVLREGNGLCASPAHGLNSRDQARRHWRSYV